MILRIHVQGIVQGVGFRPFVFRLAVSLELDGWVYNASDGVHILAQGNPEALSEFCRRLEEDKPPAAIISSVMSQPATEQPEPGFIICSSDPVQGERTLVSPDLATCADCLEELLDVDDRRYCYPFINCTNCGPRFTIINRLPYDRSSTTMQPFEMCALCSKEYHDPADRRFHAQPDACFDCGPELEFVLAQGNKADAVSQAAIACAAELLLKGGVLAVKGLGGYHLVCDATNGQAVSTLRARKHRPRKPFAVLYPNLESVQQSFVVSQAEADLLVSPASPIVLLMHQKGKHCQPSAPRETKQGSKLSLDPLVRGELQEVGVMLPATPVQHLLIQAVGRPLVMTSGNLSEEPIIGDDHLAKSLLSVVADAFLINNREIVSRYDDSVLRVLKQPFSGRQFVRRARGFAPLPLTLPLCLSANQTILAVGPQQKSSFCLSNKSQAFMSQHLGDLNTVSAFNNYLATLELYQQLFTLRPALMACDMHPAYMSTEWAKEQAAKQDVPLLEVQHHHAHIAAALAENFANLAPADRHGNYEVIGMALDGTGYGTDGSIWGGELLIASLSSFKRLAHLEPFRLPGGEQAIRHPLRAAYALLMHHGLTDHPAAKAVRDRLGQNNLELIERMVEQSINAPWTSSAGRLFDAASALLGVCDEASYEGEPAILLEAALLGGGDEPLRKTAQPSTCDNIIATGQIIQTLLDGMLAGKTTAELAQYFHEALLNAFVDAAILARKQSAIKIVALSGGVFNNRFMATHMPRLLQNEGFIVLTHQELPPNDGCISYGQAVVALAQLAARDKMPPCV
ncbi:MAG: carbamoyltransferase HypF [Coriobacteriia bacterium]|nr:carbamoyltransferase HypF [Coriobacteriia bacterium]